VTHRTERPQPWQQIAADLYAVAQGAACRCTPAEREGHRIVLTEYICLRCRALDAYELEATTANPTFNDGERT
jgi:hypothetical protein